MGLIAAVKRWFDMLFKSKAKEEFDIKDVSSPEMEAFVLKCANIYRGRPHWVDTEAHIKTINFAKAVCSETARLATLAVGITADGSTRAKWIQEQLDKIYFSLRHWVEYGCAYVPLILQPSIASIDIVTPDRFTVTDQSNGDITGCVFLNREVDGSGKKYYSRLEYHRFLESGQYAISNRCYVSDTPEGDGKPIEIDSTPWAGMLEDVTIENVTKPLFGVFRTPQANNIDIDSPMGMPIFAEAIEELKDLDIAYSRNAGEIQDSERVSLIDDRLVILSSIMVSQKDDGIIATEIEKCINEYEGALFFLESSKNLTSMRKIYSDFCANSAAMSKIFIHRKFRDMYDVIFSQEITNLAINRGNRNDQIKSIIEALKDDSDNLMETLAVYLIDCDSQLSTTAATLFLHRNTVTYRLNKIKQITNTDFTLMPATYDFYLAAALWRLNKNS